MTKLERKLVVFLSAHWQLVFTLLSTLILLIAIAQQYFRYDLTSNGLLIGWDTPEYVRKSNDLLVYGPVYTYSYWQQPEFYILLLISVGKEIGLANGERLIPLVLGSLLGVANYLITLRVSSDRRVAAVAALLTPLMMGNLKLVGDAHRNLLAYAIILFTLAAGFKLDGSFSTFRKAKLLYLPIGLAVTAFIQFETFAFFAVILLLATIILRKSRAFMEALLLVGIPTVAMFLVFPRFFLDYFGHPVLLIRNPLTFNDLVLWTGGTWLSFALLLIGASYLIYLTRSRPSILSAILLSWGLVTLTFFSLVLLGLIPFLQFPSEFAWRSTFVLPSAVLIAIGFVPLVLAVRRIAKQSSSWKFFGQNGRTILFAGGILFLLGLVITSSGIVTAYNYGIYLQPYVNPSITQELAAVKSIIGTNLFPEPVFVFQGSSVSRVGLYRSYVGSIVGIHFAYYGTLENLLQLKQSNATSSDPTTREEENFWGPAYFTELTTGVGRTGYNYFHKDGISSAAELLDHPIVIITPDFYESNLPFYLIRFRVTAGIYVIEPNALSNSTIEPVAGPPISIALDGSKSNVTSMYQYLDPASSETAIVTVAPPSGSTSYNITSIPGGWHFDQIVQGGYVSAPEISPVRPNQDPAIVGNDPADSVQNWTAFGSNLSLLSNYTSIEGPGSLQVSGKVDSMGNIGATLTMQNAVDGTNQDTLSFWATCNVRCTLALLLFDENGSSATYWALNSLKSDTTIWNRFVVQLSTPTSTTGNFDAHRIKAFRFFIGNGKSGTNYALRIDDVTLDKAATATDYIFKGRVHPADKMLFTFMVNVPGAPPLPEAPPAITWPLVIVIFAVAPLAVIIACLFTRKWPKAEPSVATPGRIENA